MNNSLIFFKKGSKEVYDYQGYDCCESLGRNINDGSITELYVAIPKIEMDAFFLEESNLALYLKLIEDVIAVHFEIDKTATAKNLCGYSGITPETFDAFVIIKHTRKIRGEFTNKRFNAAYNLLRYQWYPRYQNVAIIATNLFKLKLVSPVDTLALAESFQTDANRALLPSRTMELPGLLFFRESADVITDLNRDMQFNKAFYMYPIYFNPIVEIKGTFFSEASSIYEAKTEIGKLIGIEDVSTIPPYAIASLRSIAEEYLRMKEIYRMLLKEFSTLNLVMNFSDYILLSDTVKNHKIALYGPMGGSYYRYLNIRNGIPYVTDTVMKETKETVEKPV